jgi:hypothetical protein
MLKVAGKVRTLENPNKNGRDGEIRTRDLLNPIQTRYQATLRPDVRSLAKRRGNVTTIRPEFNSFR